MVYLSAEPHRGGKTGTFLRWSGVVLGPVSSGVCTAGDNWGWRVKELLLHVGRFDKRTRCPEQNDTVEHLQSDHPAHKHTKHAHACDKNNIKNQNSNCVQNSENNTLPQIKQQHTHKGERTLDLHWAGYYSDQLENETQTNDQISDQCISTIKATTHTSINITGYFHKQWLTSRARGRGMKPILLDTESL